MIKLFAKAIAALFILAIVGLIIFLLPAHLDIRANHPALPTLEDISALSDVSGKPNQVSYILTSSQSALGSVIGHHTIVVEWPNGKTFLIDTGMDPTEAEKFGELLETMWGADPVTVHTTTTQALGNKLESVEGVGLTHLHIDHAQGLVDLCAASNNFKVYQSETQRTVFNMNTQESAEIVKQCDQTAVDGASLSSIEGFPGLAMYNLGGHTPGSTLFVVSTDSQTYLFSGDITNTKYDVDHNVDKAWWYSYLIVPEDTARTAQIRTWLKAADETQGMSVIVSHDVANTAAHLPAFEY